MDGDEANGFALHGTREVDLGDAIGGKARRKQISMLWSGKRRATSWWTLRLLSGVNGDRSLDLVGSQRDGSHAVQVGRGSTFGVPRLPFFVMPVSLSQPLDVAFPAPLLYFSTFL